MFDKGQGEFLYTVIVRNATGNHLSAINSIVQFVTHQEPIWEFNGRVSFFKAGIIKEGRVNLFTRELGCQICKTTPAVFKEETDFNKRFCGLKCQKEFYQKIK